MEEGAVTPSYGGDRDAVVKVLNDALATEIVCVLRYKRHYFMAQGIASDSVKKEFLEHAREEQARQEKHRNEPRAGRLPIAPGALHPSSIPKPRARRNGAGVILTNR
jgi:hypothetical protein